MTTSLIMFLVFIAVFLHKFPEGFTIGSMVLQRARAAARS